MVIAGPRFSDKFLFFFGYLFATTGFHWLIKLLIQEDYFKINEIFAKYVIILVISL